MDSYLASYEWNKFQILAFDEIYMRIGIDVRLWNQTGVGRYIRNLVQNLQTIDKKNEYVLFARSEDSGNIKILNPKFRIVRADIKWHSIAEQITLPKKINKENLDVVHFPYYSVPISYKKPFIVTIHDLIPLHFQTGKASTLPFPLYKIKFLLYKIVVSRAAKNAKKIIAPSNFSKKEIVSLLKVRDLKVAVIYEGTDKVLADSVQTEGQKDHFLYIGNAYPHKNLELLIEVFSELPDLKLILVGKEDYFYKRLKRKAEKLNLGNLKFHGFASDLELQSLYRNAKALIIPSFIEGFGLPALEAMSNRCIVLASNIKTLREICGDAAIYFNPRDKNDLKEKIIRLLSSSSEDFVEKGIKRASEFSWKKATEETLKIYESSA